MKHKIVIDGEEKLLDIRPTDESLIVYCKLWEAPLTRDQIPEPKPGEPEYVMREFLRKQVQIVGSCLILAWEGDGIIGKMHFTTRELYEALGWYCVDPDPECLGESVPKIQAFTNGELTRLMRSESRTLRIKCFNVGHLDKRWHGQGIAKAMIECLKEWARDRGWRRIEAESCAEIVPTNIVGPSILRRGALERRGFHLAERIQVSPKEAARRLADIEAYLAGTKEYGHWQKWYADHVHRLAADPAWRSEYDKDYLMACDL